MKKLLLMIAAALVLGGCAQTVNYKSVELAVAMCSKHSQGGVRSITEEFGFDGYILVTARCTDGTTVKRSYVER